MKQTICKHCGAVNSHYSFQCYTQRKPIKVGEVVKMTWEKYQEKKKNIPNISEREKKRLKEYRIIRDKWLKTVSHCQFPKCYNREVQLHHGAGRIGSLLTDTRYFVALCDTHHHWVELHPLKAKEMRLSFNRLDK